MNSLAGLIDSPAVSSAITGVATVCGAHVLRLMLRDRIDERLLRDGSKTTVKNLVKVRRAERRRRWRPPSGEL